MDTGLHVALVFDCCCLFARYRRGWPKVDAARLIFPMEFAATGAGGRREQGYRRLLPTIYKGTPESADNIHGCCCRSNGWAMDRVPGESRRAPLRVDVECIDGLWPLSLSGCSKADDLEPVLLLPRASSFLRVWNLRCWRTTKKAF
ncbi:hypothetical protein C4K37_4837 [Pseudomonas chlororaphis subsp. piscium]|nr:hypothetical protein C4K37_4837 [Pseudomonas chlororaphis subsp. piscium]AZC45757.1 hypothetical protein C4K36_4850 [Pseudomonas chlororaphis subsp. piscium]